MSVRAYRVNNIEWENESTFNVWHHTSLVDFFNEHDEFSHSLSEDSVGLTEVSLALLKSTAKIFSSLS